MNRDEAVTSLEEEFERNKDATSSAGDAGHNADSPVVKLANMIIARGVTQRASEFFVEALRNCVVVRYRIDGILHDGLVAPKKAQDSLFRRFKIMAEMDFLSKQPQEGVIHLLVEDRPYIFPIAFMSSSWGGSLHFCLYDPAHITEERDDDLTETQRATLEELGLFLFVGPPDSGKSTTAFRCLHRFRSRARRILTLLGRHRYEPDGLPPLYRNPAHGITYAATVPLLVRQNPDLLFLGDLDTSEAWEAAVWAAEQGVRVWGIAQASDAQDILRRLPNLCPTRDTAQVISGICAQRLLRRPCPECRTTNNADGDISENPPVYRGSGCPACIGTGYRGRIAAFETLALTDEIRGLLANGGASEPLRDAARRAGLVPMEEDARAKVEACLTTPDELRRAFGASRPDC